MNHISKADLLRRLKDYTVIFVIGKDLSVTRLSSEEVSDPNEGGYAFKKGEAIVWLRSSDGYLMETLVEELGMLKRQVMHHAYQAKGLSLGEWLGEDKL